MAVTWFDSVVVTVRLRNIALSTLSSSSGGVLGVVAEWSHGGSSLQLHFSGDLAGWSEPEKRLIGIAHCLFIKGDGCTFRGLSSLSAPKLLIVPDWLIGCSHFTLI